MAVDASSITFIVCENVRRELDRKLTFVGVYTGRTIVVQREGEPTSKPAGEGDKRDRPLALPSLHLYFGFMPGPGEHHYSLELIDPSGRDLFRRRADDKVNVTNAAQSVDLLLQVTPFPLAPGNYTAKLTIDQQTIERTFAVTYTDPEAIPGA
jgi:hypothetical protein